MGVTEGKLPREGIFPGVEYNENETQFLKAMDSYKNKTGRKFPSWTEALAVLESLGWRRVAKPVGLPSYPTLRREAAEATAIKHALQKHNNNRLLAAKELGISRTHLYNRLHELGIFRRKQ